MGYCLQLHHQSICGNDSEVREIVNLSYKLEGIARNVGKHAGGDVIKVDGGMLSQQRSATVDIMPPQNFPPVESL